MSVDTLQALKNFNILSFYCFRSAGKHSGTFLYRIHTFHSSVPSNILIATFVNSTAIDLVIFTSQRFIYEAETMLASPKSPDITFGGTTPGVIGTQEVYKSVYTLLFISLLDMLHLF